MTPCPSCPFAACRGCEWQPDPRPTCECGRGPVVACAFQRNTSLLIRRIGDMGHRAAADWRCADCIADMAEEVAACPIRPFHRDFQNPDPKEAPREVPQEAS